MGYDRPFKINFPSSFARTSPDTAFVTINASGPLVPIGHETFIRFVAGAFFRMFAPEHAALFIVVYDETAFAYRSCVVRKDLNFVTAFGTRL
jgi:hypothetical protein